MKMKIKIKGAKKMRGFMCQSPLVTTTTAAAASCMPNNDPRSVILPIRRKTLVDHHTRLMTGTTNKAKYTRLVDPPASPTTTRSMVVVPSSTNNTKYTKLVHPPASPNTTRSMVVVPSSINNTKYTKLVHPRSPTTKAMVVPSSTTIKYRQHSPLPTPDRDQLFKVVVMRVSLHCQGCAGKVKRHLSKMEGVTSFSIDLESKRVTVMGKVSPLGVLESISKVKRAEFWPC